MPKLKGSRKKPSFKLKSSWIRPLLIVSILLFIVSFGAWWQIVRNSPRNVFQGMLNNNLRTSSVTRTIRQQSGPQQLEQTIYFQSQPEPIANSITNLEQTGAASATVVTESIGQPQTDYVRYLQIETGQTDEDGEAQDYSDVEGIWGINQSEGEAALAELYGDSALGVLPFGNLTQSQRDELLAKIEADNVYTIDYSSVERVSDNGRLYYNYVINVDPEAYVGMLKAFARYTGITQLESLDAEQFRGSPALTFGVTVDVLTRRLAVLTASGGEREERFSSYGMKREVEIPEDPITVEELQSKVQQVQ